MAALLALSFVALAQSRPSQMRIQYAEPVDISPVVGTVEFDAYGRRFSLELDSNDRLLATLPAHRKAELQRYRLLRGKVAGQANSWVRLTAFGGRVEGAIWDGQDLYAITRYADIAHALSTPLDVRADQTVTFRLSDTFNALPENFCAVERSAGVAKSSGNALGIYKSMVGELRASAMSTPVTRQMDVALIGDTEYQALESADPTGAMVARLNTADGIYADQVGLLLNAGALVLVPAGSDPFTTNEPSALLQQVSTYRAGTPAVRSAGIAHLITGKSLTGTTIGIARINGVCTVNDAVSLSQGTVGVFMTGLIMAHEIGHNLGAEHDGTGACGAVGDGYIMWPSINSTARRFSQCSLDAMRPVINSASCMTPVSVADVTVSLSSPPEAEVDTPMTLTANVTSAGANLARNVAVTFNIPGGVTATAITSTAGTCALTPAPGCTFGDLPAGELRTVSVTLMPHLTTPQVLVSAEVGATNDRVVNNNSTFTTFAVITNVDAAVSVQPGAATVRTGDPVDYTIKISSIRTATVRNASMALSPAGLDQVTYTPSAGTCNVFGICNFGDLAPGAMVTLAVHGIASRAGTYRHDIRLDSQNDSGNNNFSKFDLVINPSYNVKLTGETNATIDVGATHTTRFTVSNTAGLYAVTNVRVTLFADASTPLQGATVAGGTCNIESGFRATCQLGDLAVAESRTVSVTVTGAMKGYGSVSARVSADRNEVTSDDDASHGIDVRNPVDLRLAMPSLTDRVEKVSGTERVPIYSASTIAAADFEATVELPVGLRLTALAMADTTCQVIDEQHGRCRAVILAHQMTRELWVTSTGEVPGLHKVRVTISATSEADTSDNTIEYNLRINPFIDASVTPINLPQYLFMGQVYEFETHLKSSYRDVPNVRFSVTYPVDVLVTAPAELTGCTVQRDSSNMYETIYCELPLVAANTDRLLKFQLQPQSLGNGGRVGVQAITSGDVNWNNDYFEKFVQVVEKSDGEVRVAANTASASAGSVLNVPRITVRAGTKDLHGIVVKIPMPTSLANFRAISSLYSCTGSPVLECQVGSLGAGSEATVDLVLDAFQSGTFTSKVELIAANDSNTANNAVDVAITVNPGAGAGSSSGGGSSSSGGGGGGVGRLEWLAMAMLGALATRRILRRRLN